tara:strand:+ start:12929 stop:14746 length:1818 start_codon:yes stop_codon:yes gene_type:complete
MKFKSIIFSLVVMTSCGAIQSQIVGQDSNGFSSIIEASATINLDVTNNVASITFYQDKFEKVEGLGLAFSTGTTDCQKYTTQGEIGDCLKKQWEEHMEKYNSLNPSYFTLGFELKGNSSNGISTLVANEEVASGGSAGLFLGYNIRKLKYKENKAEQIINLDFLEKEFKKNRDKYNDSIRLELKALIDKELITNEERDQFLKIKVFFNQDFKKQMLQIIKSLNTLKIKRQVLQDNLKLKKNNELLELETFEDLLRLKAIKSIKDAASKVIEEINDPGSSEKLRLEKVREFANAQSNAKSYLNEIKLDGKEVLVPSTWTTILKELEKERLKSELKILRAEAKVSNSTSDTYDEIIRLFDEYLTFLKSNKKNIGKGNEIRQNVLYAVNTNLFYAKAAFTGSSFTYDANTNATTIAERFEKREFQGYRIESGFTRNYWLYNFIGFNAAINRTNNVSSLLKTTYKFENTITGVMDGNLTTSREINALSGTYRRFLRYDLSFDYAYLIPFKKKDATTASKDNKSNLLLSINPYFRHSFYGSGSNLKPSTSIGAGAYAFNTNNGSIAGGVFLQGNDLFNNNVIEPEALTEKITFGIVVKANIKSFNPSRKK